MRLVGLPVDQRRDVVETLRLVVLASVIAAMTAACASLEAGANLPPSSTATTLMSGWENHFTLEWAADQGQNGARRVTGYITNRKGEYALDMRVLAQALDTSGTVVGQRIAFVPGGVGGASRVYFVVPNLPVASSYRVSVWDYTWAQGVGDKQ
jgi:hypothetical protein